VKTGLSTFIEVGTALMKIRDEKLYEEVYTTFEACCQEEFGLVRSQAYYQIDAALVLSSIDDKDHLPSNVGQARELTPLLDDSDELNAVWEEALEKTGNHPTARDIAEVREAHRQKTTEQLIALFSKDEHALHKSLKQGQTVVVNYHIHPNLIEWAELTSCLERIDRKSIWGNPFILEDDGDRKTVIASYKDHYLPYKPSLQKKLPELKGRALACWCVPNACHGNVLAILVDLPEEYDEEDDNE
jgi:proteasome lid subunit RPN8/RPN11